MFSERSFDEYKIGRIAKINWQLEPQGSLDKFWFVDRNTEKFYLFKQGRENTTQNIAEKVACEICEVIDIPHAHYDFANSEGVQGVITESLVSQDGVNTRLTFANEYLEKLYKDYDAKKMYRHKEYRLNRALSLFIMNDKMSDNPRYIYPFQPGSLYEESFIENKRTAFDMFASYLVLDTLIGNQDRHHENWGFIIGSDTNKWLSPTYDHASSLGHNLLDVQRELRLQTNDKRQTVEAFVGKAKSAFYYNKGEKRLPSLCCLCEVSKHLGTDRFDPIRRQVSLLNDAKIIEILRKVPTEIGSDITLEFMYEMLKCNRDRILELTYGKYKASICRNQKCPN